MRLVCNLGIKNDFFHIAQCWKLKIDTKLVQCDFCEVWYGSMFGLDFYQHHMVPMELFSLLIQSRSQRKQLANFCCIKVMEEKKMGQEKEIETQFQSSGFDHPDDLKASKKELGNCAVWKWMNCSQKSKVFVRLSGSVNAHMQSLLKAQKRRLSLEIYSKFI